MKDWSILVVDDDPKWLTIARELLEFAGVTVDVAADAQQALGLLTKHTYTAAIIDLSLPGMSGWDLLKAIREDTNQKSMACFAITAYHSPQVARETVLVGFRAYFSKPIHPETFITNLSRYLN